MTDDDGCPKIPELQRLLLGQLPESETERLERHVGYCARCVQSLHQLEEEDMMVRRARAQPADGRPRDAAAGDLITRLEAPALRRRILRGDDRQPGSGCFHALQRRQHRRGPDR